LVDGARDVLRLGDYLTRWDSDQFWHSADYGLGSRAVRALWPARLRSDRVYARMDSLFDSASPARRLERTARWRPGPPRVFREVLVPLGGLARFLDKLAVLAPGVPVWTCPVGAATGPDGGAGPDSGADAGPGPWAYCGVWGPGAHRRDAHNVGAENAIDREAAALGGRTVRSRA
jgi:hypothetical protein